MCPVPWVAIDDSSPMPFFLNDSSESEADRFAIIFYIHILLFFAIIGAVEHSKALFCIVLEKAWDEQRSIFSARIAIN